MAAPHRSVSKTGKKRKYDESSVLNTSPMKKVKASGLDFAERKARDASHSEHDPGENESALKPTESGLRIRKKTRSRPKIKSKETAGDISSKPAGRVEQQALKKKERREKKRANKSLTKENGKTEGPSKREERKEVGELVQRRQKWSASLPSGGYFSPQDPIFVQGAEEKQFLISATGREVHLLSLADSLVTRSYYLPNGHSISSLALDAANDNLVHIACRNGATYTWIWSSNSAATKGIDLDANVLDIACGLRTHDNTSLLYSISRMGTKFSIFSQGTLLFTTSQSLQSIRVVGNGEYIVCHGQSALIVGTSKGDSQDAYTWVEFPLVSTAACIDARVMPPRRGGDKSTTGRSGLSVAVGFTDGRIHLFQDLSSLFNQGQTSSMIPDPRILHWHRTAVSAVKFSPDGHYLISGGAETVLVLWQLETGQRQYSPHLKAAIDRIAVSSKGNRYALQMGDHSIIVLNSSDFKAAAYFAKLQAICPVEFTGKASELPRISAALHPLDANQLLIAVPSTQPKSNRDVVGRPFLQTFDAFRSSHIRLQALQRNFTTEVGVAPNGSRLIPPDVTCIAISCGGAWLATVDEWAPATLDLEHLVGNWEHLAEEQRKRREVYLRFWGWDQTRESWIEEYTRESPHSRTNGEMIGAGKVLALASDPASNSFATIGEDGCVRIWSTGNGRLRDSSKWKCQHSIELPYARSSFNMLDESTLLDSSAWHLAYSSDGSLLLVAYSKPLMVTSGAPNEVFFINTSNGDIHSSKSGRTGGDIKDVAFLGRYYMVLSTRAIYVWDFVDDRLMYKAKVSSGRGDITDLSNIQLAANHNSMTYAVLVNNKIVVYDPRQTKRLYKQEFEQSIQCVLTSTSSPGYTLIFDDNTILTLSPSWLSQTSTHGVTDNLTVSPVPLSVTATADRNNLEEIPAVDLSASRGSGALTRQDDKTIDAEDDRPVVTPERLAEICDARADGTLPSVYDMFWGVVQMCARKPLANA